MRVSYRLDDVLEELDVINMLRIQFERLGGNPFPSVREYSHFFGLTVDRMKRAKDDIIVMHPGPINRGIEIGQAVARREGDGEEQHGVDRRADQRRHQRWHPPGPLPESVENGDVEDLRDQKGGAGADGDTRGREQRRKHDGDGETGEHHLAGPRAARRPPCSGPAPWRWEG